MTQHRSEEAAPAADFGELVRRARGGDPEAAVCLVRRFEPALRRYVRLHLTDPELRRVLDSVDICQSILGNFFVRLASGQFDLGHPDQLVGLLAKMARNKIRDYARSGWRRQKPEGLLAEGDPGLPAHDDTPLRHSSARELLDAVHGMLSPAERGILQDRLAGRTWEEVADARGEKADAVRRRFGRTLDRIARRLGLDEMNGEGSDE